MISLKAGYGFFHNFLFGASDRFYFFAGSALFSAAESAGGGESRFFCQLADSCRLLWLFGLQSIFYLADQRAADYLSFASL